MKNLSIVQSFMLCSLNETGKIPALKVEIPVCILAGGVLDLLMHDCIEIGNKKLRVSGELPKEINYLKGVYDAVAVKDTVTLEKLSEEFCFELTGKKINTLVQEVGNSLVKMGCATSENKGLFNKTSLYIPDKKQVEQVIQTMRAELLEEGNVSDETVALAILLKKSGMLKNYFSKHESEIVKVRIEEMKQSYEHKLVSDILDYVTIMIAVIAAV